MQLTKKQLEIADHFQGPALVLAVPGSGKTTVILKRCEALINKGIKKENILNLTFSRRAAQDMERRAKDNKNLRGVKFSTIHAFCLWIIRDKAKRDQAHFEILSDDIKIKSILKKIHRRNFYEEITDSQLENFIMTKSLMESLLMEADDFEREYFSLPENFRDLYMAYKEYKRENFLIDFDDMISLAQKILKENPRMRRGLASRLFIQLDEAQDTSPSQFKLIESLLDDRKNFMAVCDDDQSIYSFRGADPSYLLNFSDHFYGAKIFHMDENFRSYKKIVDLSKDFIDKNNSRYEKNPRAIRKNPARINFLRPKDSLDQSEIILDILKEDYKGTTALLYRYKASYLIPAYLLKKEGITYFSQTKDLSFFKKNNFPLLKDLLLLMEDQGNKEAFLKCHRILGLNLNHKDIEKIEKRKIYKSLFSFCLEDLSLDRERRKRLVYLKYSFENLKKKSLYEKILFLVEKLNYGSFLSSFKSYSGLSFTDPIPSLESLVIISRDFSSYDDLICGIDGLKKETEKSYFQCPISLSTIHGSKGLEFDRVIIPDLTNHEFPSKYAEEDRNGPIYQEERRLFYVAMTRAKESIYFLAPKNRLGKRQAPSPFFREIKRGSNKYSLTEILSPFNL